MILFSGVLLYNFRFLSCRFFHPEKRRKKKKESFVVSNQLHDLNAMSLIFPTRVSFRITSKWDLWEDGDTDSSNINSTCFGSVSYLLSNSWEKQARDISLSPWHSCFYFCFFQGNQKLIENDLQGLTYTHL